MSLLRLTLRAVGRLLADGTISRDLAAAMVRNAWAKSAAELLPAGHTSSAEHLATLHAAAGNDHWCEFCPEDEFPYRVTAPGTRCPSCLDRERRAS